MQLLLDFLTSEVRSSNALRKHKHCLKLHIQISCKDAISRCMDGESGFYQAFLVPVGKIRSLSSFLGRIQHPQDIIALHGMRRKGIYTIGITRKVRHEAGSLSCETTLLEILAMLKGKHLRQLSEVERRDHFVSSIARNTTGNPGSLSDLTQS